jgi:hypothetical protein
MRRKRRRWNHYSRLLRQQIHRKLANLEELSPPGGWLSLNRIRLEHSDLPGYCTAAPRGTQGAHRDKSRGLAAPRGTPGDPVVTQMVKEAPGGLQEAPQGAIR